MWAKQQGEGQSISLMNHKSQYSGSQVSEALLCPYGTKGLSPALVPPDTEKGKVAEPRKPTERELPPPSSLPTWQAVTAGDKEEGQSPLRMPPRAGPCNLDIPAKMNS